MKNSGPDTLASPPMERIRDRLRAVYGSIASADPEAIARDIETLVDHWRPRIPEARGDWSEKDAFLITYADSLTGENAAPLEVLRAFLERFVGDRISFVHLLPFFPSTSDYGFSVADYRSVRPDLGDWENVAAFTPAHRVVFDAVLNHVSSESEYVRGDLAGDPRFAGFCFAKEDGFDAANVVRPRQSPLFHEFERADGTAAELWTTFSRDQVDLDFRNPAVLLEILDVLLFYASRGAAMIRLDAIPYLWKESGTTCIHLARTHEIIRLVRAVFDAAAPHVILLSETNVPHAENVSYFGGPERDEAQIIYNFSLAPLLIHTLATRDATRLTQWARTLEDFGDSCTFLNITATHDGIGMRPTEGILGGAERAALLKIATDHGGRVSYKSNSDGSDTPYELNINYYDAINNPNEETPLDAEVNRFLLTQAVPMVLRGIPGIYIHSLLGSRSDPSNVVPGETETYRSINREQLRADSVTGELDVAGSRRSKVFGGILKLLETRRALPAFHPNAGQEILDLGPALFGVLRGNPGANAGAESGIAPLAAVFNVTGEARDLALQDFPIAAPLTDALTGDRFLESTIPMAPYQVRWLIPRNFPA